MNASETGENTSHGVSLTDDPQEDKYPHYYAVEDPSAHIWADLVYVDEVPGLGPSTVGAEPWQGGVDLSIETGGDTQMGIGASLTPENARKLAQTLIQAAEYVEADDE